MLENTIIRSFAESFSQEKRLTKALDYTHCAIAQYHEASVCVHIPLAQYNCCVRLCAREKKTRSTFDLLSEVIFKDLTVPAVTIKLTLGSWFVLAMAMFY